VNRARKMCRPLRAKDWEGIGMYFLTELKREK